MVVMVMVTAAVMAAAASAGPAAATARTAAMGVAVAVAAAAAACTSTRYTQPSVCEHGVCEGASRLGSRVECAPCVACGWSSTDRRRT